MQEEIKALKENNTWTLVPIPNNKIFSVCKCMYKIKYKSDGTIERYKVWLVAK